MSDIGRPAGEPPFSTLEVNLRGEYSTLEVKPAKPHDPFSSITAPKENVTEPSLSDTRDHWWKRYWLIILVASILVTGGVIGGAVGGTMASRKESNKTEDVDGSLTTSRIASDKLGLVNHLRGIDYHVLAFHQAYRNTWCK
ncbi:hypothetical protein ACHAP5_006693 [Fusarium lateritium]